MTPYVVQPIKVAENQIPTPVDQWQPSTELGRDFGQHLAVPQKPEGSKGAVGAGRAKALSAIPAFTIELR